MTAEQDPSEPPDRASARRLAALAAVVFLAALGVRVAFYIARGPFVTFDGQEYARLAHNLRANGAYSLDEGPPFAPSVKRPPLYPVFLTVFDPDPDAPPVALFATQIALDSLVAVLVLWLAGTFLPPGWAAAAGLAYAAHPGVVVYAAHMLTEPLYTALLAASAVALVSASRERAARWAACAGVALGLAALCRPIGLLLPFAGAAAVFAYASSRRLLRAALVVGCAALVVTPWIAWASLTEGRFVPVSEGVGQLLMPASKIDQRLVTDPSGETYDRATRDPGWVVRDVAAHPAQYLVKACRKSSRMFFSGFGLFLGAEGSPAALANGGRNGLLALKLGLLVLFSILPFALGWVGLTAARAAPAAGVCASIWLYTIAVHLPLWSEYRYWVPATPFMLVSAVAGASWLWRLRRAR